MRVYYPGALMVPLIMVIISAASLLGVERIWSWWPITLIATGMEELYLWSTTKSNK